MSFFSILEFIEQSLPFWFNWVWNYRYLKNILLYFFVSFIYIVDICFQHFLLSIIKIVGPWRIIVTQTHRIYCLELCSHANTFHWFDRIQNKNDSLYPIVGPTTVKLVLFLGMRGRSKWKWRKKILIQTLFETTLYICLSIKMMMEFKIHYTFNSGWL